MELKESGVEGGRSDAGLMAQLAGGSMEALGELVERHQERVLGLAYRVLGDWASAEDVAQDTFLRVHRAARRYRPEARFTTWLYRIVVNLCHDARRRGARQVGDVPASTPAREGDGPAEQAARRRSERVREAVDSLPDRQRMSVVLHRYQGLTHQEISDSTGWSVSAVESLLVRAYAALRPQLAPIAMEMESGRRKNDSSALEG